MVNIYMRIAILVVMIIIVFAVTWMITYLFRQNLSGQVKDKYAKMKKERIEAAQRDVDKRMAYNVMDEMLKKKGIKYRMGSNFSPFDFTVMRMLSAILFAFLGVLISPYLVVVAAILGYMFPSLYFDEENKEDNKKMMEDIGTVYSIMSRLLGSGVYLTDVTYECFLSVKNPRLKRALSELTMEIEKFADVTAAANSFKNKFDNKYINTFAKTLEQAEETGLAAELFKDIEGQIEGINEAISIREEQRKENVLFVFQTMVFLGALLFIVYILYGAFSFGI